MRVVAGAAKKVPPAVRNATRSAAVAAGADVRICPPPFVYLDKNAVTVLGGLRRALAAAAAARPGERRAVQLGRSPDIADHAVTAVEAGADVVIVDTGRRGDLVAVDARLRASGRRDQVELAFGGGVRLGDLATVRRAGADAVDVGRAIVDAPLLDMHLDIVEITP